jgi:hypothetical protein
LTLAYVQNIAMAGSTKKKSGTSAQNQLDEFIDKYLPEVAGTARACLKTMRARLAGATELVYDNYNALAIGFSPSEKASEGIFSIVLYPRYVTLFFLQGAHLPDPKKILRGDGKRVRHIRLESASDLEKPAIRELMATALKTAKRTIDRNAAGGLIIKSISAKQRARQPSRRQK